MAEIHEGRFLFPTVALDLFIEKPFHQPSLLIRRRSAVCAVDSAADRVTLSKQGPCKVSSHFTDLGAVDEYEGL